MVMVSVKYPDAALGRLFAFCMLLVNIQNNVSWINLDLCWGVVTSSIYYNLFIDNSLAPPFPNKWLHGPSIKLVGVASSVQG